jgi:AcrR family transcriptional regulator
MEPQPKPTKKEIVTEFRTREILAAARRLMQDRGVEAATMEEIAAAAGVAKGTVYLYFQSKDDLVKALLSQMGENLVRDLEVLLEIRESPREKLNRLVTFLLGFLEEERVLFAIYARDAISTGRYRWELEEKYLTLLTRFFTQGVKTHQFISTDPRLLTFMLRGLVRAAGFYQMTDSRKDVMKEVVPVVQTLLSSGLLVHHDEGTAE